jgi:hypothetical protein
MCDEKSEEKAGRGVRTLVELGLRCAADRGARGTSITLLFSAGDTES